MVVGEGLEKSQSEDEAEDVAKSLSGLMESEFNIRIYRAYEPGDSKAGKPRKIQQDVVRQWWETTGRALIREKRASPTTMPIVLPTDRSYEIGKHNIVACSAGR